MRGSREIIARSNKENPKRAYTLRIREDQLEFINEQIKIGEFFSLSETVRFSLRVYFGDKIDHFLYISSGIFSSSSFFDTENKDRLIKISFKLTKRVADRVKQFLSQYNITFSALICSALDYAIQKYFVQDGQDGQDDNTEVTHKDYAGSLFSICPTKRQEEK